MKYSKAFTGIDTNTSSGECTCDDVVTRWRKKAMRARIVIGFLTAVCCVLIVVMIVTYETRHISSQSSNCATGKKTNKRASETTVKFLHVSDFHFDPFYDKTITSHYFCRPEGVVNGTAKYVAPLGRIGCDSPMALVDLSVDAMKNVSNREDIDFLLLTGDLSAHRMWTNYSGPQRVLDNIAKVSDKMHEAFSKIPVFPMIGNNDLPGHYVLPNSTSDWYKTILSHWAPLILCTECSSEVNRPTSREVLQETFLEGGYYNASIGDGKMVLLVLNSMYWSAAVKVTEEITQKAVSQLTWLKDQLQIAKNQGQRVILASHIPPGVDSFEMSPFWFSNYTHSYVNLVAKIYSDTVAGQLFGHIHRDDFRLQITEPANEDPTGSFALLAPSISPVYKNNPAFRVVAMDTDSRSLVDYTQYYMDLVMATQFSNPVWQVDYTFSEKYPSPNKLLDTDRVRELSQQLINQTSNKFWNGYILSRETNYQPGPYSRFVLYCAMKHAFFEDFGRCIARYSVPGG